MIQIPQNIDENLRIILQFMNDELARLKNELEKLKAEVAMGNR